MRDSAFVVDFIPFAIHGRARITGIPTIRPIASGETVSLLHFPHICTHA